MNALLGYAWPGNVRELENVLERALVLAEGPRVCAADLPNHLRDGSASNGLGPAGDPTGEEDLSVKRRGAELESYLIRKALLRTGGHRGKAAEILDLSDRALRYKIQGVWTGRGWLGSKPDESACYRYPSAPKPAPASRYEFQRPYSS